MELLVLDKNLESIFIIDNFESLIWTERYFKCGDFEIYTTVTEDLLKYAKQDNYLWYKDSEHVMIIEGVQITSDVEDGNCLIINGRSLESMLDRRIIWKQTVLSGNFQDGIKKLIDENVISPEIVERKIENFIFKVSEDEKITTLTIDAQFEMGDNLYDAIQKLCESKKVGFRITLSVDNQFVFELYSGIDRSYDQDLIPYVIFSPKFDNLINSNYLESTKTLKTIALVGGEGEDTNRKTMIVESENGGGSGLTRRELFVDARGISTTVDGHEISGSEYNEQLKQKGTEELSANSTTKSFEGQVETTRLFVYGVNFFKGDIVQIENEYGIQSKSRVIEVVRSQATDGVDVYPTFETVEGKETEGGET